jgi:hypothetical protein
MSTSTLEFLETDVTAGARTFASSFVLVVVRRRRPGFNPALSGPSVSFADREVDADRARLRTSLLPHDLNRLLNQAYGRVTRAVESLTVPFPVGMARVLPIRAIEDFGSQVDEARAQLDIAVNTFCDRYAEDVVAWNREYWEPRLGQGYEAQIGRYLPDVAKIRHRFGVDVSCFEIKEAGALEIEQADVANHLTQWRQTAREQLDAAMADVIEAPRRQLEHELTRLDEQLRSGTVLQPASFNATLAAIRLVGAFGDVAGSDLLTRAREMEGQITATVDAAALTRNITASITERRDTILAAITPALEACRNEISLAESQSRFGIARRRFTIGSEAEADAPELA